MAFGAEDTARLCQQYRDAMPHWSAGHDRALSERLQAVEEAVRFLAALQSRRGLTNDEIARLVAIAHGAGDLTGALPARTERHGLR